MSSPSRPSSTTVHHLVLSFCFLSAFLSYYVQFEGLYSRRGVAPLLSTFELDFGSFAFSILDAHLVQLLCFLGVVVSSLAVTDSARRPLYFPLLTLSYHQLMSSSSTSNAPFYNFQWDALLQEAGFAASVESLLSSPLLLGASSSGASSSLPTHLTRLVTFKLMFMSFLAKVQSRCPTWLHLTALEFHYATQPLPTFLSWHALNHLPPILHRASVAATLIIEGAAPLLLLFPTVATRSFGAKLQIALQLLIAATGSYTFFNLLTGGLAAGCWEGSDWSDWGRSRAGAPSAARRVLSIAEVLLATLALAYCASSMFALGSYSAAPVSVASPPSSGLLSVLALRYNPAPSTVDAIAEAVIPAAVNFAVGHALLVGAKDTALASLSRDWLRALKTAAVAPIVAAALCGIALPLYTLTNGLRERNLGDGARGVVPRIGSAVYFGAGGMGAMSFR